jgi:anti-sigma factor RsiW
MTTFNLTCEAVEATLPDYLDETLEPWVRASIDEHLAECARCTALARELRNITREAAALPALLPEGDVWPRIAGRIGAPVITSEPVADIAPETPRAEPPIVSASDGFLPFSEPRAAAAEATVVSESPPLEREVPLPPNASWVPVSTPPPAVTSEPTTLEREVPLPPTESPPLVTTPAPPPGDASVPRTAAVYTLADRREKRWGPGRMGLAAAALVLVTAGTTSLLTVQWLGRARTPNVANEGARRASSSVTPAERGIRAPSVRREQIASGSSTPTPPPGQLGSALTVSGTTAAAVTPSPEDAVYDKEINTLQRIVRRQKPGLDTSTVVVIEKNLRSVDAAIAQIRAALKKDPGSPLLGGQASRALEMKVELLRRAAMLRSNT